MKPFFHWNFKRLIFELKTKILKPKIYGNFQKAKKDLYSNKINELNFKRRKQIVSYAYANSIFYKEKYKDFDGQLNLTKEDDFLKLPPVTRDDLANNFEKFITKNPRSKKHKKVTSSGSTGRPVSVLQDPDFPYTTLQWRILDWWGIEPYENQAFIYRYERPKLQSWANAVLWWPTQRTFLAGAKMDLENARTFANKINKIKPALLQGYVDVVYEFALFVLDNGLKIHSPKMVWVTSAPLFDNQRKLMEKAFGAPVCDQYGNTEVFTIAAECPEKKGLHIMHDAVHVEFVDNDNHPVPIGRSGKILVTDLRNRLFPLIRYETGDRGRRSTDLCNCEIPLPLMDNVRGRQSITLKTPSGLSVRGEHLALLFEKHMKDIRQIQLIQNKDYSVAFCYVTDNMDTIDDEVELILGDLKTKTRGEIQIDATLVAEVQHKGNKSPLIISQIS